MDDLPARTQRRPWLSQALRLAAIASMTASCESSETLVEPLRFFEFDPANSWLICDVPGALGAPATRYIPAPPGTHLEVCPNPAPAGTQSITFRFRLDVRVPTVNLGVFDRQGRLIQGLVVARSFDTDVWHEVQWFVGGVPAGDYRAYFRAGTLESAGDVRIER